MSDSIPEYYRHLAEQNDTGEEQPVQREPSSEAVPRAAPDASEASRSFHADAFRLQLPGGTWQDRSVYTLTGPTTSGIQHNITITRDDEVEAESLYDFAARQIASLELRLEGCRLLLDDEIQLDCGLPAYRAIYIWYPEDDLKLYQEQLYVLHDGCGYTLTASFTCTTRKQFGLAVERMMRSFQPIDAGP